MKQYKIFQVARFELWRQLSKPSFWFALFALPALIIGFTFLGALNSKGMGDLAKSQQSSDQFKTIGIYDQSGVIPANLYQKLEHQEVLRISNLDEGRKAIQEGKLNIFYHLPSDFAEHFTAEAVALKNDKIFGPSKSAPLKNLLQGLAMTRVSQLDLAILTNQLEVNTQTITQAGETINPLGRAVVPIFVLIVFYLLVSVFGNRQLTALVEEKENRISEMILTAITARDLIIGKIIALVILSLIQIFTLVVPVLSYLVISRDQPMIASLWQSAEFNPFVIAANLSLLFISVCFFIGLSIYISTLTPTVREASQFFSFIAIGVMLPFFTINLFLSGEANTFTTIVTYFPLSTPVAVMLRNAAGTISNFEFALAGAELLLCTLLTGYSAIRSFQKNAITFTLVNPLKFSWRGPRRKWHL